MSGVMNKILAIAVLAFTISFASFSQKKDLNYFLENAVNNDPQFSEVQGLILQNKIDSAIIVAANRVQINANGNAMYAPVINGFGYDMAITNGGQLSALVALNKQINNRPNLRLQFRSLQLQTDSIINSSAIYKQDVKKAIVIQYIAAYGTQLQLEVSDQIIALLSGEEKILKILTQQNVYKQTDYLAFLVVLQQQQLARNQLQLQFKNDYATLNYLAGLKDTSAEKLEDPQLQVIRNFQPYNSPFFFTFRLDSLRISNERNIIKVQYRPRVNLFADAGYQSSLVTTPYRNFGYSFGINLSVPIYDGHQKKLQLSKFDIDERMRMHRFDFFKTQFEQQIQQLQQQLQGVESLSTSINTQLEYLETLIKVDRNLLQTGDIKIADFVLALNNYITAKNLLAQNQIARYQVVQQLNYWNMKL